MNLAYGPAWQKMRVNQAVAIEIDAVPGVKFAAHVQSFQRAAGSYFSALPAENATGNYVKVTQRVPVKIVFDHPEDLQKYNVGPDRYLELLHKGKQSVSVPVIASLNGAGNRRAHW